MIHILFFIILYSVCSLSSSYCQDGMPAIAKELGSTVIKEGINLLKKSFGDDSSSSNYQENSSKSRSLNQTKKINLSNSLMSTLSSVKSLPDIQALSGAKIDLNNLVNSNVIPQIPAFPKQVSKSQKQKGFSKNSGSKPPNALAREVNKKVNRPTKSNIKTPNTTANRSKRK